MSAAPQVRPGRELYVRHARLDGRSVAVLRAIDEGERCVIEVDVWPTGPDDPPSSTSAGPYVFPSSADATRFVTHAVETLIALGCEVRAS